MSQPLQLLIIDDSENDALLTIRQLKKDGYDPSFKRVETAEQVLKTLAEQEWDVVICDHAMPKFNSLEALKIIRDKLLDIPFIIVSGNIGEELAVKAMKAGAHDYIMKNNLIRLTPAIEREIREAKDRAELRLKEIQLVQAQKLEAIGKLSGGIAHDFNNLLTVIISYSQFLLHELDQDHPLHEDAEEIFKASQKAATLTRQLLAFSRTQALNPKVLNLNELIEHTEKMLSRIIGEDIALHIKSGPNLSSVKADPGQIEQVIMNLVVNARDAMPQGGKLIIETANVELDKEFTNAYANIQPGPHVMLAISDTGIGMDEETQSQVL